MRTVIRNFALAAAVASTLVAAHPRTARADEALTVQRAAWSLRLGVASPVVVQGYYGYGNPYYPPTYDPYGPYGPYGAYGSYAYAPPAYPYYPGWGYYPGRSYRYPYYGYYRYRPYRRHRWWGWR